MATKCHHCGVGKARAQPPCKDQLREAEVRGLLETLLGLDMHIWEALLG